MTSVTGRIKDIKQPYGGYLPIKHMVSQRYEDDFALHPYENTAPSLVGLTVDYLTRVMLGDDPVEAFEVSIYGIAIATKLKLNISIYPESMPTDLSDESITNAVILSSFDSIFRATPQAYREPVLPDKHTIENIRQMVKRSVLFFTEEYRITKSGFSLEGAYTDTITAGDGDMLTETGLWDMKVLRGKLTTQYSLQLLIYWRMGLRSIHPEFEDIRLLGFYNPRKNEATTIETAYISDSIIKTVEEEVIGYA